MTVSSTANKIIYTGNGSTTNFPFTFAVPAGETGSDIQVYFTNALGIITQLTQGAGTAQYTISFNSSVSPDPTPIGGTVVYNPSGSPIPLGTFLTIIRQVPDTQLTQFVNQGTIYPAAIESALDYGTMQIQQLAELLGRQITVAISDPTPAMLPPAAQRANLAFMFDSLGNPIAAAPGGANSPVSSAMAPVVNAVSIAAALALLGLTGVTPLPSGMIAPFAGAAPSGWLLCAGQAVSRATFAALFAYCGTQFGAGDGSTTFNLPDLRGRMIAGIDNMNGIAANRLSANSIPNGGGQTTVGGSGGAEAVTIAVGQLPAHTHTATVTDPGHVHPIDGKANTAGGARPSFTADANATSLNTDSAVTGITVSNSSTGSGNPVYPISPAMVLNLCIKT